MTEWKYLERPPFDTRQVIAAHWVKDIPLVVELGSYKTPIHNFLSATQRAILVDERCDAKTDYKTYVIKSAYPAELPLSGEDSYAVILLGLHLQMREDGWQKLYGLINNSKALVIEFPPEHIASQRQHDLILKNTNKKVVHTVTLDLFANDFGDLTGSAPLMAVRRMFLLE